jgi:hypothetical protein
MNIFLTLSLIKQNLRDRRIPLFSLNSFKFISKKIKPSFKNRINLAKNAECAYYEVDNWELSEFIVKKIIPITGYRPFPLNELLLLVGSVIRFQPDAIFEWGTHIGKSARVFYEAKKYFKISCQIHSIDLPDDVFHAEHPHDSRGYLVKGKDVILHLGDGIETSLALVSQHKYKNPLFYIDGDHSYESVKRELSAILDKVPHANILLHDTFFQSKESGYNIGPYLAIEECLTDNNSYKVISINTGLPGMTLLYR